MLSCCICPLSIRCLISRSPSCFSVTVMGGSEVGNRDGVCQSGGHSDLLRPESLVCHHVTAGFHRRILLPLYRVDAHGRGVINNY